MKDGISIQNVSFAYTKNDPVLKNISFEIKPGIFLGITGVNGSGKSTFSYLLNGLIPHLIKGKLTGNVSINGISTKSESVAFFAKKVGMVFQNPDFSIFNLTVREEIEFGLKNLKLDNRQARVKKALKAVNMTDYIDRDPQTLSLGEKEKVSLAAILALETDYIVLDEPTAQLDYKSSIELYKILSSLNKQGKTIITIEHDTDFLSEFASQIMILDKGKIEASGQTRKVLSDKNMLSKLGIKIPKI
jgi:energy-coupling factor transport system ATP-binding protein